MSTPTPEEADLRSHPEDEAEAYALYFRRDGEPLDIAPSCTGLRVLHAQKKGAGACVRDPEDETQPLILDPDEPPEGLPPGKYRLLQVSDNGRAIPGAECGYLEVVGELATKAPQPSPLEAAHTKAIDALTSTVERLANLCDKLVNKHASIPPYLEVPQVGATGEPAGPLDVLLQGLIARAGQQQAPQQQTAAAGGIDLSKVPPEVLKFLQDLGMKPGA